MLDSRRLVIFVTVLLSGVYANADVVIHSAADGSVTFSANTVGNGTCSGAGQTGTACAIDIGQAAVEQTMLINDSGTWRTRVNYGGTQGDQWNTLENRLVNYYPGKWWSAMGKAVTICYKRIVPFNVWQVRGQCVQVTPKPVMCSISGSKDVTIPLGSVNRTAFTGVGSPGGSPVTRNISLNCPQSTSAKLTVDGNPGETGYNGTVLQVNQVAGAATGVGVKLSSNGKPIVLKTALNTGPLPSGISNIPITASFVQTKPAITGGNATTSATYTLTYQ